MDKDKSLIPRPATGLTTTPITSNRVVRRMTDELLAQARNTQLQHARYRNGNLGVRDTWKGLGQTVRKQNITGFVFANIMNDLADAASEIDEDGNPLLIMAYGYARRAASAALYVQGLVNGSDYTYTKTIFKSLQLRTGTTVEFQELSFAEAVRYLTEYHTEINTKNIKLIVMLAEQGKVCSGWSTDEYLFEYITNAANICEQASGSGININGLCQMDANKVIEFDDGIQAWLDSTTGLMWEVKNKSNISHWYVFDKKWLGGITEYIESNMENEIKDCASYVSHLNNINYAGYSDWRLPMIHELLSIVNESGGEFHIKKPLSMNSSSAYWSSSLIQAASHSDTAIECNDVDAVDQVYIIQFRNVLSDQRVCGYSPGNALWLRCVRSHGGI